MNIENYNIVIKNKNEFLEKAINKYNGRYIYPNIDNEFQNGHSIITIHCKKHNIDFKTKARAHLRHSGCSLCFKELLSLPKEIFLQRAKSIHGDKYDYSKINYIDGRTKVEIVCPKHGSFWQKPRHHSVFGQGCKQCVLEKQRKYNIKIEHILSQHTKEKLINKLELRFPTIKVDKDSVTAYESISNFNCVNHGKFSATFKHILYTGCKYCNRNSEEKRRIFIEKAKKVNGDNVDYSKLDMNDHKPTFICKIHNVEYQQEKRNHILYKGCPICISKVHKLTNSEFIKKAIEIHGNKYDYSKTSYTGNKNKVIITCPKHGDREVTAGEHIRTNRPATGCSVCSNRSVGELKTINLLNKNNIKYIYQYKEKEYLFRWDFIIPDINLNIEIDDDSHIYSKECKQYDKIKDKYMLYKGYKIIRIPYLRLNIMIKKLKSVLIENIKYQRDGKCFRSFKEFCSYYNLPKETKLKDVQEFKFTLKD